ncbi:MAG: flagellar hook-basal body protein [Candidatus Eremiobacteraeota bacterium]|nr:flagellar hook-basal body protein [Candidatus Eremiobacteraeota bacterium]
MNIALLVAASGMEAQQNHLDVIADNLANADVPGFKGEAAAFADVRFPGGRGLGVVSIGTHVVFEQGKLEKSGGPFDLAIDGPGLFEIRKGDRVAYTRDGAFHRGADGTLQTADGWRLGGARIPSDAVSVRAEANGRVWCERRSTLATCGRIRIAEFPAPENLRAVGNARFVATERSGSARLIEPGGERDPKVAFGMLEHSNVSIIVSMVEILATQRAYEANAKGVQAADEMQRIANNLHRT